MAQQPDTLARMVVDRMKARVPQIVEGMKARLGEPLSAAPLTQQQQVKLWNYRDPNADPVQAAMLIAQGQHAQALKLLYPYRDMLMGKGSVAMRVQRAEQFNQLSQRLSGQSEQPGMMGNGTA